MDRFFDKVDQGQIVLKKRRRLNHEIANPNSMCDIDKFYLMDEYEDISDEDARMFTNWNVNSLNPVMLFIDQYDNLDLHLFFVDEPVTSIDDVQALGNLHLEKRDDNEFKREVWVSQDGKNVRITTRQKILEQVYTNQANFHLLPVQIESSNTGLVKYIYAADGTKNKKSAIPVEEKEYEPGLITSNAEQTY